MRIYIYICLCIDWNLVNQWRQKHRNKERLVRISSWHRKLQPSDPSELPGKPGICNHQTNQINCPQLSLYQCTLHQDMCLSPLFSTLLDISLTHSLMATPLRVSNTSWLSAPLPSLANLFRSIILRTLAAHPTPLPIIKYLLRASMVIYTPHAPVEPYSPCCHP